MDGGQIMVIVIVAIVMVGSIIKAGVRGSARFHYHNPGEGQTRAENQRLRDEVQELKERIKVLERITVEKENSLAKEIESLRDR
jgi:cell division protein FtsB